MVDITVAVQRDHILKLVRPSQPVSAVIELIWNGIDADAKNVSVHLDRNPVRGVDAVEVVDDGTGISRSGVAAAFERLGGSWKASAKLSPISRRPMHGENGEGRFRAFALGGHVEWVTVADDVDGRFKTLISADADRPERFEVRDLGPTQEPTGTRVRVTGSVAPLTSLLSDSARDRITREFARRLRRYRDTEISYDGSTLDIAGVIERTTSGMLASPDEHDGRPPVIEIIEWSRDFPRELIICDADGFALSEFRPGIHAPSFSFAAYVTWHGFERSEAPLADMGHERYQPILDEAREYLRTHFRAREKERSGEILDGWRLEGSYPFKGDPNTRIEVTKRELFDVVAIQALPGIPSELKAKKLSLRLIREALEHSPSSLKQVLSEILDLSDQQLDDLAGLLDRTSLGSVISAAQIVSDRLDFLRSLELLLFDETLKKDVLERSQLHRMLAAEPWIFGEHYALGVDDQSIKEVLARHLEKLGRDSLNLADVKIEDRKTAIVDLMLSKTIQDTEKQHHLVVELKRPDCTIGYKERQQIEAYGLAVANDQRFRDAGTKWDFVLVANNLSDDVRRLSNKKNQPVGLIHDDDDLDLRIWIRHWGSIIEERRRALHFYREKLEIDPSRDEALDFLRRKYSQFLPASIRGEQSEAS